MQSLPISYLKDSNQLIYMMDSCSKYADTIILNNEDGIGKYVFMSIDEYNRLLGIQSIPQYDDKGIQLC